MQRMFMWSFAVAVALTGSALAGCRQITDLDSLDFSGVGGAGGGSSTASSGMGGAIASTGSGGGGEGGGVGGEGGAGGAGGALDSCGNGAVEAPEKCDDGNMNPGDGCNNCGVEFGFVCFGSPNQCFRGNTNAVTGRCFFIHPIKMKWGSANQGCKDYGGTLARIFDQNDQNTVGDISRLEDIFLGASDTVLEGTFKWVTGEPLTFTAWKDLQPDDYMGEDCLVMQITDEWNDVICDTSKPFLCDRDSCE
jgi:cysteine-rich repeat protein